MGLKGMSKAQMFGIVAAMVIAVVGIVLTAINIDYTSVRQVSYGIVNLIMYLLVLYYAIAGYKKPHGNLLKWIILIFAISIFINFTSYYYIIRSIFGDTANYYSQSDRSSDITSLQRGIAEILMVASCVFIGYMAGRLHKFKKNVTIACCVFVALIVKCFFMGEVGMIFANDAIIWAVIVITYVVRYTLHKEAGLQDTADAK